jgi:hypothetical protein
MALVPIVLAWLALMCFVLALCRSARAGDLQSCGEDPIRMSSPEAAAERDSRPPARTLPPRGIAADVEPVRVQRPLRRAVRPPQELVRAGARR